MADWKVDIYNDTDLSNYISANGRNFKAGDKLYTVYHSSIGQKNITYQSGLNAGETLQNIAPNLRGLDLYVEVVSPPLIRENIKYAQVAPQLMPLGFSYKYTSHIKRIFLVGQVTSILPSFDKAPLGYYEMYWDGGYVEVVDASQLTYYYKAKEVSILQAPQIFRVRGAAFDVQFILGDWTSQITSWTMLFSKMSAKDPYSHLLPPDILTKYDWSRVRSFDRAFEENEYFEKIVFPKVVYREDIKNHYFKASWLRLCYLSKAREILNVPILSRPISFFRDISSQNGANIQPPQPDELTASSAFGRCEKLTKLTYCPIDKNINIDTYNGYVDPGNNMVFEPTSYMKEVDVGSFFKYFGQGCFREGKGNPIWRNTKNQDVIYDYGNISSYISSYEMLRVSDDSNATPSNIKTSPKLPDDFPYSDYGYQKKPNYLGPDSSYLFKRVDGAGGVNLNNFVFIRG